MKKLTRSGIQLGILLLLLAIASCILTFSIRNQRVEDPAPSAASAQ